MFKVSLDQSKPVTISKPTPTLALQRAAINPSLAHQAPPLVHEVLRSPGRPLETATREFMEPRFGHNFSKISTHAGKVAQTLEPVPSKVTPETERTAETPSTGLIADDEASELGPGQMRKSELFDELQRAVCAAADTELATVRRSTSGILQRKCTCGGKELNL